MVPWAAGRQRSKKFTNVVDHVQPRKIVGRRGNFRRSRNGVAPATGGTSAEFGRTGQVG
jgi:hypothetical protein